MLAANGCMSDNAMGLPRARRCHSAARVTVPGEGSAGSHQGVRCRPSGRCPRRRLGSCSRTWCHRRRLLRMRKRRPFGSVRRRVLAGRGERACRAPRRPPTPTRHQIGVRAPGPQRPGARQGGVAPGGGGRGDCHDVHGQHRAGERMPPPPPSLRAGTPERRAPAPFAKLPVAGFLPDLRQAHGRRAEHVLSNCEPQLLSTRARRCPTRRRATGLEGSDSLSARALPRGGPDRVPPHACKAARRHG